MPELTDQLLESLMYRSEDPSVDYKAAQYVFSRKDLPDDPSLSKPEKAARFEKKKSELLKDVLAMANAWRDGAAYILLGFKEDTPRAPTVVGLPDDTHYDDAQFQQFFEGKLNRPLNFKYEVRELRGLPVGVISIPKQARPLYAKEGFGVVDAGVVYVRRGSSTAVALPDEIAAMGADSAAVQRPAADVRLKFFDAGGAALDGKEHEIRVPVFPPGKLPNLVPASGPFGTSFTRLPVNSDYWRDLAAWVRKRKQAVPIELRIENRSSFALTHCEVHVEAVLDVTQVELRAGGKDGSTPSTSFFPDLGNFRRAWDLDFVEEKSGAEGGAVVISWGKVLPGATRNAAKQFSAFAPSTGTVRLKATLYAAELPEPITTEFCFQVSAEVEEWTFERLKEISKL